MLNFELWILNLKIRSQKEQTDPISMFRNEDRFSDFNKHLKGLSSKPSGNTLFRNESKVCPIENNTNLNSFFCLIKSSKIDFIFFSAFYLIMWLMTSPKNFEKITILKIWQLVSLKLSKFTLVRNMIDLSLKYWFIEAKVVFWICSGPKK